MDSQLSPGSKGSSRAYWTAVQDRVLLQLMIEQIQLGRKDGKSFKKTAWSTMLARFSKKFQGYDIPQLKNRLKYYRVHYKVVNNLASQTGFSWDSATRTVKAEDSVWDEYISKHPKAARYRDKAWRFYEDWQIICGNASAEGRNASTSQQVFLADEVMGGNGTGVGSPIRNVISTRDSLDIEESQCSDEDASRPVQLAMPLSSNGGSRRRKRQAKGLQDALYEVASASRFSAAMRSESKVEKYPVEDCIKILDEMEGLEEDLYMKALVVLRDEYNRRVFMSIKGERRLGWLLTLCRGDEPKAVTM